MSDRRNTDRWNTRTANSRVVEHVRSVLAKSFESFAKNVEVLWCAVLYVCVLYILLKGGRNKEAEEHLLLYNFVVSSAS